MDISFDDFNLQSASIITSRATPRPAPPKIIQRLKLARQDGSKVVANYEDEKIIEVEGHLLSPNATASGYKGLIDNFKQALSAEEAQLVITDGDSTRVYTASVDSVIDIPYEHYYVDYSPFKVNFLCSDPFGYDQAFTTWSGTTISGSSYSVPTLTFSGTKEPVPLFNYYITASGQIHGIELVNSDNNQSIRVDRPYGAYQYNDGDILSLDCQALTAKINGSEVTYSGIFPQFGLGSNSNLKTNFYRSLTTEETQQNLNIGVGETPTNYLAQSFTPGLTGNCNWVDLLIRRLETDSETITQNLNDGSEIIVDNEDYKGQTFTPTITGSLTWVKVWIKKIGSPGNFNIDIKATDANGKPTGSNLATQAVSASSISTTMGWITINLSTPPTLTANTKYALILRSSTVYPNCYYTSERSTNPYSGGTAVITLDSGSSWDLVGSSDLPFQANISAAPLGDLTVEIRTNSAGVPSSTVLATTTISKAIIATPYTWNRATFASPTALTAGVLYWIVIYAANSTPQNAYFWNYCNVGAYNKNRAFSVDLGSSWTADNSAFLFKAYIATADSPGFNQLVNLEMKYKRRWR